MGKRVSFLDALLIFAVAAALIKVLGGPPLALFITAALGIIPMAAWMGRATEALAHRTGPAMSAFLNASFGNAAEMIIAMVALKEGYTTLVKASITGSLLGNLLLVLGASMVIGGIRRPMQRFDAVTAGVQATLMLLATMALFLPAIFHHLQHASSRFVLDLSTEIALILLGVYGLSLVFTFKTHAHLLPHPAVSQPASLPVSRAVGMLFGGLVGVVVLSEWMIRVMEPVLRTLGWSEFFVGVVIVAVVGNVAEHTAALWMAWKDEMDVALGIAMGSSVQIALFVAPLLVLMARVVGWEMDLLFDPLEIIAVALAVWVTHAVAHDGRSHWLEGVMLLAAYAMLAIGFFFWHPTGG